jgi:AcrR family transcriptional regulator
MARPRAQIDFSLLSPVFARDGVDRASVDDLAKACGLAKPTLYERVGGKAEVFRATAEFELERLLERLHDAADRTRFAGARERIAALAVELADADRSGARLLFVVDPAPSGLRRLRTAISEPLRRDSPLDAAAADAIAWALLGAYSLAIASGEQFDADQVADLLSRGVPAEQPAEAPHWGA